MNYIIVMNGSALHPANWLALLNSLNIPPQRHFLFQCPHCLFKLPSSKLYVGLWIIITQHFFKILFQTGVKVNIVHRLWWLIITLSATSQVAYSSSEPIVPITVKRESRKMLLQEIKSLSGGAKWHNAKTRQHTTAAPGRWCGFQNSWLVQWRYKQIVSEPFFYYAISCFLVTVTSFCNRCAALHIKIKTWNASCVETVGKKGWSAGINRSVGTKHHRQK